LKDVDEATGAVRCYHADIILEHPVEGDARDLVHLNTQLMFGDDERP
jgi:hypothetical protein